MSNKNEFYNVLGTVFLDKFLQDNEPYDKSLKNIYINYKQASNKERKVINSVLINLCGWNFPTLCKMAKKEIDIDIDIDFNNEKDKYKCPYCGFVSSKNRWNEATEIDFNVKLTNAGIIEIQKAKDPSCPEPNAFFTCPNCFEISIAEKIEVIF